MSINPAGSGPFESSLGGMNLKPLFVNKLPDYFDYRLSLLFSSQVQTFPYEVSFAVISDDVEIDMAGCSSNLCTPFDFYVRHVAMSTLLFRN